MSILIFAEQHNGIFKKAAFECATEASRLSASLGLPVAAVVIGEKASGIAPQLGQYGVSKIQTAEMPELTDYSTEAYTTVISEIAKTSHAKIILLPASIIGKDLAPRVAARLNAGMATDVTAIEIKDNALHISRPVYAGKVIQKLKLTSDIKVITLRPNVFKSDEKPVTPDISAYQATVGPVRTKVVQKSSGGAKKTDLTESDVIVTGGRGMKAAENWSLLTELADTLGAAYGASRAVVDGGWRPHDEQVGQTGKTVSPKLYFAVGISGAIQHVAGMASSKCIVAINNDPEAPIFKIADYGIIGDAMEVLPALTNEIKKLK